MARNSRPLATSQNLTVLLIEPAASIRPSGEKAMAPTEFTLRLRSSRPAVRSQSLIT
jgi:hypothetical protein